MSRALDIFFYEIMHNLKKLYDIISDKKSNVFSEMLKGVCIMNQILIIEDDRGLGQGLCQALKTSDRKVIVCADLKSAREQISCQMPDVILLDLNLPDGNGLSLLKELRGKSRKPPVILLTANDTEEDVVNGLESGADDYITKPFSLAVLRARVNTQLRKAEDREKTGNLITGPYFFNFAAQKFCVKGIPVELSKNEQKLLRLLLENKGRIMERAVLVDRIWTDGAEYVDENALSVTIKRLRDKLNAQNYIRTVYGIGYEWVNNDE